MQWFEYSVQTIVGGRDDNQMNMVGHEAICKYCKSVLVAVFFEPSQIGFAIFVCEKNVLAPITSLGDVVRKSSKHCSG